MKLETVLDSFVSLVLFVMSQDQGGIKFDDLEDKKYSFFYFKSDQSHR